MKEKLAGAAGKVKEFFGNMSKKSRTMLGVGTGLVLLLIVAVVIFTNNQPYEPLFTGMTGTDMQSVVSYLEQSGVTDYRIQNGDTVLVRREQEPQLKSQLILAGYPKSGFGYDLYLGNVGALSTDADRRNALLFDLQNRMAGVVRCMDGVQDAHVTINVGEESNMVLAPSQNLKASASITVTMQPGHTLTKDQATAILNMVAKSVKGLTIEEIALSDTAGNNYSGGGTADKISDASELRIYLEERESNRARTEIMRALSALYGEENVRVGVSCTVDVNRRVGESTTYTSPQGADPGRGIIDREVYQRELVDGDTETVGGVVGTESNADLPGYVREELGQAGEYPYGGASGEVDHKVNESKEQVEYLAGTVTDMMVSVTINATTAGSVDVDRLSQHVATAAQITPEQREGRISILVQPFYQTEQPAPPPSEFNQLPPWAIYAAIGGGALFLFLLILILVLRGKRRKRRAKQIIEEAGITFIPDAGQQMGADIMTIRNEKSMELRKDVRQFAESNPEIAAQLVKSWLRGGEENG